MRMTSPAFYDKINTRLGTEPILVIQIDWAGAIGTKHYASKALQFGSVAITEARILGVNSINFQVKSEYSGAFSSFSFSLDDYDGSIKLALNSTRSQKAKVTVYQVIDNLSASDSLILFYGKIVGPISWSEGERAVALEAETDVEGFEVGYAPQEDDFDDLDEAAQNVTWPLVFGTPAHVPAVRVKRQRRGMLKADLKLWSGVYEITDKTVKLKETTEVETTYQTEPSPGVFDTVVQANRIYVEGGWRFPQGSQVEIVIDGVIFEGSFADDMFIVSKANKARVVSIGNRPSGELAEFDILWITDPNTSIIGHHCYSTDWGYNYCTRQEGRKCYFRFPFKKKSNGELISPTSGQMEVLTVQKGGLKMAPDKYSDYLTAYNDFRAADPARPNALKSELLEALLKKAPPSANLFTTLYSGVEVRLNVPDPDVYIANSVPSEYVRSVYAERYIYQQDGTKKKVFVPVPKSYFTIETNYSIPNYGNCTALIFHTPLEDYHQQDWLGEIFVTLKSTIGPNTIDIINWLVANYTNLTPSSTNNSVKTKLDKYPMHFALLSQIDSISLIEQLAYQARCATLIDGQALAVRYLSEQPNPIFTFNEDKILEKSAEVEISEIEELATMFKGVFRESYAPEPPDRSRRKFPRRESFPEYGKAKHWTWYENTNIYGEIQREYNFYAYNSQALVAKSVRFWGHRYANAWKKIKVKTPLVGLPLQPFDGVTILSSTILNIVSAFGVVESISYSPESYEIEFIIWLPFTSGSGTQDPNAWMSDAGDSIPRNLALEFGLTDYNVQVTSENSIV